MPGVMIEQVVMADFRQRLFAAKRRVAVRVVIENERITVDRHQRAQVGPLGGLDQRNVPIQFLLELVLRQHRAHQHVGDEGDHERRIPGQELGRHRGNLGGDAR